MYRGWTVKVTGEHDIQVVKPGAPLLMEWTCKAEKGGKYLITKSFGTNPDECRDKIVRAIDLHEGPVQLSLEELSKEILRFV